MTPEKSTTNAINIQTYILRKFYISFFDKWILFSTILLFIYKFEDLEFFRIYLSNIFHHQWHVSDVCSTSQKTAFQKYYQWRLLEMHAECCVYPNNFKMPQNPTLYGTNSCLLILFTFCLPAFLPWFLQKGTLLSSL